MDVAGVCISRAVIVRLSERVWRGSQMLNTQMHRFPLWPGVYPTRKTLNHIIMLTAPTINQMHPQCCRATAERSGVVATLFGSDAT